ncbi:acyl-CoA dehydrogenase family protein [Rhodococcoides corynebacterioides]|uniref:Monooxygenase n=1 Tax=Rhodococcoides corynebacterioides TaxID=53972 RepID=A0ABS7P1A6_9NOCA|nr:acyl-CoA dehydrogenase family protein [Rhodococcus corynebacterioides]MBY6365469.1 monooxygenase [Rhodococcus corynebacterioides]MBY6407877.1 monooxygenase [Rhodococcus corynebacterioides]
MTITENRPTGTGARWTTAPTSPEGWIDRAREVAAILAEDAVARDRGTDAPHAEVTLLKDSGLATVLGPVEFGGGGQTWETAYRLIREVATADGSIGQLYGYHLLWFWAARLVGTSEQIAAVEQAATENRWFFGGAVNPRDNDVEITDEGDTLVYHGAKTFSTGSRVSDVTVLEGVLAGTDTHVFAIVPSDSEGLTFHDDWDNIGQRRTESGSVTIDHVRTEWSSAAGFVDKVFQPRVYNTLNVPIIQLVFVNFYLGIARGALDSAAEYTRTTTRAWLHSTVDNALDEPYIVDLYGDYTAKLWAAEALADAVAAEQQRLHDDADAVTETQRGEHEVRVAAAKARATEVALEITAGIFEALGARATASSHGFDRFWRNVRTHTLHDPVFYKRREVGRHVLTGELPTPTWYS